METTQLNRRDRTSLGALEILVATDSHGSISAAARALGLTQPTASAALRRLERAIGMPLVVRAARGSVLTDTGRATAAWAREVLEASDRFETAVVALRETPSARVRIAASMTIAEHLAPRWLAARATATNEAMSTRRPSADVELVVRNSSEVMAMVLDGEANLGFVESQTIRRGLRHKTFARDRLVAVVAAGHPWGRRRTLSVADLLSARLVVRESGSGTRQTFERALERAGESLPAHVPYLGSTAAVMTAVLHSQSVAVVSTRAVAEEVARGSVHTIAVPGLDLSRELRMVWKDGTDLSPAVREVAAQAMRSDRQASTV